MQAKLTIGQPGDLYEQEADQVAAQVLRRPEPGQAERQSGAEDNQAPRVPRVGPAGAEALHRQPMEEEEEALLQTKAVGGETPQISPAVEAHIHHVRGGGQPLPESVRAFFEPRFGQDFSQVRVHTDAQAAESARAVNALAYTVGQDVVFGAGQYAPETESGKKLLAHELTHVVQQKNNHPHSLIYRSVGVAVQRQVAEQEAGAPAKSGPPIFPPDIIADTTARRRIEAVKKEKYLWQAAHGIEEIVRTGGHKEATWDERLWMIDILMADMLTASNLKAQLDLWESFEGDLMQVAVDNIDLFKRSYERGIVSRLEPFKRIREAFEKDVKLIAKDYLRKNSSLVLGELERVGLAESARPTAGPLMDVVPERERVLGEIQAAAAKVVAAQKAMNDLMTIPVGYMEGMGRRALLYFPDMPPPMEYVGEVYGHFDGDGWVIDFIPGQDQGEPDAGSYQLEKWTMLGYAGVQRVHEQLKEEMAKFTNAYPAVYAAIQAGKVDELAKGSPQEAKAIVQAVLTGVQDNILKTYPKLEGDDDFWYKLKPIHSQLYRGAVVGPSGTAWKDPLLLFIAEQMVKKYEQSEFWKDLGLSTLAAAAFVVAELATAGGATFFIAAGIGTGITTYQVYKSWDEYFTLSQTADTEVNEELQLVYPGQVSGALLGAILQTVFGFLDVGGPAKHWAKAARAGLVPEAAMKGAAAAEIKGLEGLTRRFAAKEITPAEAKVIVEKSVFDLGVGGAARRAGVEPRELLRYVDRDSEAGRRIAEYVKSPMLGEGAAAIKIRSRYKGRATTKVVKSDVEDWPEGLVHYGLDEKDAVKSYDKSVFEDPTREAGIWKDLDSGEHVAVQGGEDFVTASWMKDAEFAGRRWHLVEHFQPTSASRLERYASVDDFDSLMKPYWDAKPPVDPPGEISSRIRWHDARTGKPHYTTFGFNPAAEEPFWIEFLDPRTNKIRRESFEAMLYPRVGPNYRPFLDGEAKWFNVEIDWTTTRDPGVPVNWSSHPDPNVQRPVGGAAKTVAAGVASTLTEQLRKLASLAPAEAEAALSRAIEEIGPAAALRAVDMDWKTLAATLPKPSGAGKKLLHWRDEVLGGEIRNLLPQEKALRTGTKGSFENDFDWNFLGAEAVENRAMVISFLSGRTGMTPEEMRKLLAADFFTDPRRMFLYEQLPAGIRDRVAKRQAEIERQLIWNGQLTEAVAKGDKALESRIRGQMQRLGVPEVKGGVKLMSPEDIRVAEAEIDKLHKEFEQAMKRKDYATAEQRATDIADRQAQINAASGGAYVSYGGVRKFAVEREPELAVTLEGEEMLQPGWYMAVLDQMPHMRHAIEELEEATTKGDMAAAMRAIGKYGDRMTNMANLGLAKSAVGHAAFEDLEWDFKLLYARSKIAANDVMSLQWVLTADLKETLAKVTKLLDDLEASSEEVLAMLQKTADVDVLLEEVQLFTHLHVKFLKLKQATYWQITTILKALSQGRLPEGWR